MICRRGAAAEVINMSNEKDIEYTIVMDPEYAAAVSAKKDSDPKHAIDLLYEEYERSCLGGASVLDRDDIYPRSYQWRMGDKYDPAKVGLVREALRQNRLIADTEEYQEFLEESKKSKVETFSWD